VPDHQQDPQLSTAAPAVRVPLPRTRSVVIGVASVVALLVALGIVAGWLRGTGREDGGATGFVTLFHLDNEFNVPAIVSVWGLLLAALLLVLVAGCLRRLELADARRWWWLGVAFAYISLDEGARIHERANVLVSDLAITEGPLRFGWVLFGIAVVAALVPVYLPAVWRLQPRVRWLMLAAATIYVAGALGMEMIGAMLYYRGTDDVRYLTAVVLEEGGELTGIGLFLVALWTWWRAIAPRTTLEHPGTFPDPESGTDGPPTGTTADTASGAADALASPTTVEVSSGSSARG
jgi:hypothetical protein